MTRPPFRQVIRPDDVGLDVLAVKRALKRHKAQDAEKIKLNRRAGASFVHTIKSVQHNHGMKADGIYGSRTHGIVAGWKDGFDAYGRSLYNHAAIRKTHPSQDPPLPRIWPPSVFWVDNRGFYGRPGSEWGIHPALVPQVKAICNKFGLSVTAGYGGHPPHAYFSDHRVGLAVDLAGSLENMRRCNLWADGMRGHTFRWVGGPAHDADGVEPGHYNHVHLSWYRTRPTTIFGTSLFK